MAITSNESIQVMSKTIKIIYSGTVICRARKVLKRRDWLPFEKAREYVHNLNLNNYAGWLTYCKSGRRPNNIPSHPDLVYRAEWKGFRDWLNAASCSQ